MSDVDEADEAVDMVGGVKVCFLLLRFLVSSAPESFFLCLESSLASVVVTGCLLFRSLVWVVGGVGMCGFQEHGRVI